MNEIDFSLVVAIDNKLGIGKNNTLPWRLKFDMAYFKKLTTQTNDKTNQNAVIMGRKTWDSIPEKFRPLPDRINLVCSRTRNVEDLDHTCRSLDEALLLAKDMDAENIFVIGGGQLYSQAINMPNCKTVYVTELNKSFNCNVLFPIFKNKFNIASSSNPMEENGIIYNFNVYKRKD